MIKVIIVEDELLVRQGMRSLINWQEMGFELLEDATNGTQALQRIRSEKPEIVLLDINIPEINGIELLHIMKNEYLYPKVVVISCYDDFDTMKNILQFGITDYIRKHTLTKQELTETLLKIKDSFFHANTTTGTTPFNSSKLIVKDEFYNVDESYLSGICMCMYFATGEKPNLEVVQATCNQVLLKNNVMYKLFDKDKMLILHLSKPISKDIVAQIVSQISHFLSTDIYAIISDVFEENAKIRKQIDEALVIEHIGFYLDAQRIYKMSDNVKIYTVVPFDIKNHLSKLDAALNNINLNDLLKVVSNLIDELKSCKFISTDIIKRLIVDIISRFSQYSLNLSGSIEEVKVFGNSNHYKSISDIRNFIELHDWCKEFVKSYVNCFTIRQKCANSTLLNCILLYIQQNLSAPIQLSTVAKQVGVTEPYLSSFFKKEMGVNFIPYVNEHKMKIAKELLLSDTNINEIYEQLGYENYSYFVKVFKSTFGLSPKRYYDKCKNEKTSEQDAIL